MTPQDEVEEWLRHAPKCIGIEVPIAVRKEYRTVYALGQMTPRFIENGYAGEIHFRAAKWNKEKSDSIG